MNRLMLSVAVLAVSAAGLYAQASWRTYRNTEFHFRILYPPTWIQSTPRGENVRIAVYAPGTPSPATCNTVVRPVPELAHSTQAELNAEVSKGALDAEGWKALGGDKWPDYALLETRLTKVDNRPAYFAITELSTETVDRKLYFKGMAVVTFSPGLVWQHNCAARGTSQEDARMNYLQFESTMRRVLGSLVFETWE